jgi:thiol-disulfide isomerase/thioredoxin
MASFAIGKCMKIRILAVFVFLVALTGGSIADVIDGVKSALATGNFSAANSALSRYRDQHGADPAYMEALSWMARASLQARQLDQAENYAQQTESLVREQLKAQSLDTNPHLPIALGAAIEVQAQVLDDRGQRDKAVALLRRSLATYGATSIRARLQKNLNLLGLVGQPAPALITAPYLGVRPSPLANMKGSPVLLFFWAHWCGDCKREGPILSELSSEFASKGLQVLAPTQLYGYAAAGEDAKPKDELTYVGKVWQQYYPALQNVPVPVSKANFDRYGASTTPTLVLIDRKGNVALYHPGLMPYDELKNAIERALAG